MEKRRKVIFLRLFIPGIILIGLLSGIFQGRDEFANKRELEGRYIPPEGKRWLFVGQDLETIHDYCTAKDMPKPSGTTTYLNFYALDREEIHAYGGLGIDNDYRPWEAEADWGSGPLNAYKNLIRYPDAAVSVGLSIVEEKGAGWTLDAILAGEFDRCIKKLAYFIETADRPVFLRIGYEFDGIWNNYPKEGYIRVFRYIADKIRKDSEFQGAGRNMVTVWQACSSPSNEKSRGVHEDIGQWYPGDDAVDWIGLSYFVPQAGLEDDIMDQHRLADEVLDYGRDRKKPVIIAEASPQGFSNSQLTRKTVGWIDGNAAKLITEYDKSKQGAKELWADWYALLFDYIDRNSDIICALSYINTDWDSQPMWGFPYSSGYWGDARVEVNSDIRNLWIDEISDKAWLKGGEKLRRKLFPAAGG